MLPSVVRLSSQGLRVHTACSSQMPLPTNNVRGKGRELRVRDLSRDESAMYDGPVEALPHLRRGQLRCSMAPRA